jgi:hypothetical protein
MCGLLDYRGFLATRSSIAVIFELTFPIRFVIRKIDRINVDKLKTLDDNTKILIVVVIKFSNFPIYHAAFRRIHLQDFRHFMLHGNYYFL